MKVSKIFTILIVIVACVVIGALVLNVLLPNTATAIVDAVEDQIYKATKITLDLNGNGNKGDNQDTYTNLNSKDSTNANGAHSGGVGVNGFK